jgi:nucleotide-binding universal stress UspA family protein
MSNATSPRPVPSRRILVGVDFSPTSELAVQHAVAIARHTGAPLALAHVGLVPDSDDLDVAGGASTGPYRALLQLRLAEDRRRLASLRERIAGQGVELSQVVLEDMPDSGLIAAGKELDADLIVVGSHGRTGMSRFLLGSVAERVVRHADCSVLVARGEAVPGGYRRIVVGTDFSAPAAAALEWALTVAAPSADVRVVHGWSLTSLQANDPADLVALAGAIDTARGEATSRFGRELLAARRRSDVRLHFDAVEGPASAVLIDASCDADLVVVGSHGRRGVRRWLMGSVAEAVARHADCSALVAR